MTDQLAAKIEAARKRADQAKARLAALEARASEQARKLRNGQKIIVGSLVIEAARHNQAVRQALLSILDQGLVREVDKARLSPLLADLRGLEAPPPSPAPKPLGVNQTASEQPQTAE